MVEAQDNTVYIRLLILIIGLNIAFSMVFVYIGVWYGQELSCGYDRIDSYNGMLMDSGYTLDSNEEKLLQYYDFEDHNTNEYLICIIGNVTGNPVLSFVNYNSTVLEVFSMDANNEKVCFHINTNIKDQYLGVECVTCSPGNKITFYQDLTGPESSIIYDTASTAVDFGADISIEVSKKDVCDGFFRFFIKMYVLISMALLLAIGLTVGISKMGDAFNIE